MIGHDNVTEEEAFGFTARVMVAMNNGSVSLEGMKHIYWDALSKFVEDREKLKNR